MSKPKWTPAQQDCIHARGGTVLVSAAAGSGKTAVLIERIVSLICDEDAPMDIDKLLVVTFTKAAAAEMRARLHKRLAEMLSADPHNRHLLRQQMLLPSALICTTDSFCIQLLREYASRAGVSAQFRIADTTQLRLLKSDAARDVIAQAHKSGSAAFIDLCNTLTDDRSDESLVEELLNTYEFIQAHPFPLKWLDLQQACYEKPCDLEKSVWGQILLRRACDNLQAAVETLSAAIDEMADDTAITAAYGNTFSTALATTLAAMEHMGGTWDEAVAAVRTIAFPPFKSLSKYEDKAFKDHIRDMRNYAQELVQSAANDCLSYTQAQADEELAEAAPLIGAMLDLVRNFTARFDALKAEQQLLDFNDVIHRLLLLLATPNDDGTFTKSDVAYEISERFAHIMVDEYQDTNATQDTLFSLLSNNEQNLFFVGDLKQSIYGFRQAMPEVFQGRRERSTPYNGVDYPAAITLGHNFRSRTQVADITNFMFRKLMTRDNCGMAYDAQEELVASAVFPNAGDTAYDAELIITDQRTHPKGYSRHEIEARLIGERIHELMQSGFMVTDKSGMRQLEYRDCCILMRSVEKRAPDFIKTLQAMGIPAATDKRGNLFACAEIRVVMAVLRAIDNPLLDVPMLAAMMSPIFGFTPDEIAQIRMAANHVPLYSAVRAAARKSDAIAAHCQQFLNALKHYRTLSAALPADKLIRRLYEDTDLLSVMSARTGGSMRIANLRKFYDMAREFEDHGWRGLSAFIRYMTRLEEKGIAIDAASAGESQNAVKLMTIHHSKGLEFPVVFVAELGSQMSSMSLQKDILLHAKNGISIIHRDRENMYQTTPFHRRALLYAIKRTETAEELRLLYVAMTRAKDKLILLTTIDNLTNKLEKLSHTAPDNRQEFPTLFVPTASSMAEWVLACALRHEAGKCLTAPDMRIDCQADGLSITLRTPAFDVDVTDTSADNTDVRLPDGLEERMGFVYPYAALGQVPAKITASQTAHKQILGDNVIQLSRPAFLSKGGLTPAQRGTATHVFLEHLDLTDTHAAVQADRMVERDILTAQQRDALDLPRMQRFLESELAARMATSDMLLREFPFTIERAVTELEPHLATALPTDADKEFIVVQGIADALFEENGELVIVDYKTDRVTNGNELAARYRPQLDIYKDALSRALQRPVKECLIYSFHLNDVVKV